MFDLARSASATVRRSSTSAYSRSSASRPRLRPATRACPVRQAHAVRRPRVARRRSQPSTERRSPRLRRARRLPRCGACRSRSLRRRAGRFAAPVGRAWLVDCPDAPADVEAVAPAWWPPRRRSRRSRSRSRRFRRRAVSFFTAAAAGHRRDEREGQRRTRAAAQAGERAGWSGYFRSANSSGRLHGAAAAVKPCLAPPGRRFERERTLVSPAWHGATLSGMTAHAIGSAQLARRMPDDGRRRELVEGRLRVMAPAEPSTDGWSRRQRLLSVHVNATGSGVTFGAETGFVLSTNPDTVRAPDAAFVRRSRAETVGRTVRSGRARRISPSIVVSPGDSRDEVESKGSATGSPPA